MACATRRWAGSPALHISSRTNLSWSNSQNEAAPQLLLTLPHRQFVFSIPKALRIFFRHDQKLFASVSSLIFSLIRQFYRLAAGSPLLATSAIVAFQPFGDFLRPNAHWHALVLEGGFSPDGRFRFLPIHDTQKLTETFRRALIKLFLSKALISEGFASTLLCWKHSGLSVDNRVRIENQSCFHPDGHAAHQGGMKKSPSSRDNRLPVEAAHRPAHLARGAAGNRGASAPSRAGQ